MAGRRPLRVAVAMMLLSTTGLSARDAPAQSNEELMAIIREQQRQIDELSRKVDALTGQTQAAEDKAETATETAQKVEEEAPDIKVKWGPGATISSKDGNWSVHVFGRLQVDGGALGDDDDFYKNDNAAELRAARLGIEGHFYDWKYKFEPDFGLGEVDVKDAYIEYDGEYVEPAYVRIGQYKVPNSLEWLTNRLFITFMERAAIVDAFGLTPQIGLGSGVSGSR
jgi:phosphate-selective porin OprO and OprP